jgi:formylglycine-generating enzyme required for sulfatase activity
VTTGIGLKLTYIPPGSFTMGAIPSEPGSKPAEKPHKVTISKGFYMGTHEVTQDQYFRVMGKNPSVFQGEMLLKNKKIVETMEPGVVGNIWSRASSVDLLLGTGIRLGILTITLGLGWCWR